MISPRSFRKLLKPLYAEYYQLVRSKTAAKLFFHSCGNVTDLISDLIDNADKIAGGLQHFRHNQHEIIVFHVMDEAELTFPYERLTHFKDMVEVGVWWLTPRVCAGGI